MTTKLGRHKGVEVICEWCGANFIARKSRVKEGRGKFCSRSCGNKGKSEPKEIGIEHGKVYKSGNRCIVRWYDETGNQRNTSYGKWQWEQMYGKGSIPKGYKVGFIDENALNAVPENLYLQSPEELGRKASKRLKAVPKSESHKQALSDARKGMKLSESHARNIALATKKKWENGDFDKVHYGEYNSNWRGGVEKEYPNEYRAIVGFIRDRDRYTCQICGKRNLKGRKGAVHHIDADKYNNEQQNLILLCSKCHNKIHAKYETSPVIMAFRDKILKY